MSTELIDQLDAYGKWLEEHCATVLRSPFAAAVSDHDTEIGDIAEVEVGSRPSVSSGRRLMLAAAIVVLVGTAVVALWLHRSTSTEPADLPADPSGALFVLPPTTDGMALSNGVIWAVAPDSTSTNVVNAMIVGRRDGDGFVDIIGITDTADRPGGAPADSSTEIDTAAGKALVTAGANFAVQQRGDRWIQLTNVGDEPTIRELLQAITLTSDGIAFEPVDGFVEIDASTGKPAPAPNTTYTAAFTDGTATFTVSTTTASSPLFAPILTTNLTGVPQPFHGFAVLAPQRVEQVTINGRDGWLVVTKSDGGSSRAVNWQATPNRIVGVSGNATDEQLVDLAQRLQIVDEATWTRALPAYTRLGP
ncbi:MAG: hypothetical protein M3P52_13265 [Actinomycetota bacterium]|nr:hypothetical protein [Actinomycetota bacterium]